MAWPALEPGRLLKTCSDVRRRGMTVLDRTRLTDRLSTSLSSASLLIPRLINTEKILLLINHFKFEVQLLVFFRFALSVPLLFAVSSSACIAKSPFYKDFSRLGRLDGGVCAFL